jgi:hypothetical protein
VPTTADNVIFDQAGPYTVNDLQGSCKDFTVVSGTVTFFNAVVQGLTVAGSFVLNTTTTWSAPFIQLVFSGAGSYTINTSGQTIYNIVFNSGGTYTLASALTVSNNISNNGGGTFDTSVSNYSLTTVGLFVNTGIINLNGSTLTVTGVNFNISGGTLNCNTATLNCVYINQGSGTLNLNSSTSNCSNLNPFRSPSGAFNAGTSQINCTNAAPTFNGSGRTFYNVAFTSTALTTASITSVNTFNNLTIAARAAAGIGNVTFADNQTINGTFTLSAGTNATCRTFIKSDTLNTSRTLTCAAVSLTDGDFQDITIAGAAAPASGTRLGDAKGNSGITFPAAKTVYWNLAGNNNWSATAWATSAGGGVSANNFPLAQDTAIFTSTSPATGATTTINANYNIGTIDMSARTSNTMTLATGTTTPAIYGNWINGTGTTMTGGTNLIFAGRGSQTITGAGKNFTQPLNLNSPSGSLTLQDAITLGYGGSGTLTLTNGTLDLNGLTLTISNSLGSFATAAGTKNLTFNGGSLVSAGSFNNAQPTGFTTTAGTGTGTISLTSASVKTFTGGSSTFNCTLNQGGPGALTITGSNTFSDITNTRNTVSAATIQFTAGTTNTFANWSANGTRGKLLTIRSVTAASHTLSKASGTVNANFLSISYSTATGGATWNAINSVDGGNNTGWNITAALPTGKFFAFF